MAKIMVVDDEKEWRELCRSKLSELGHDVRTTDDCLEALIEMRRETPDIMVLDLRMPVSGRTMLQDVREDFPGLPVIVHTVYGGYRDDPTLTAIAGFAVKSPDLSELTLAVEEILHDSDAAGRTLPGDVTGNSCR
jgi:DNA-binding NtrC family response regulator